MAITDNNVDTRVMPIDRATRPPASQVMTFEAVPPAVAPTTTMPTVIWAGNCNTVATSQAASGINPNCRPTPSNTFCGSRTTRAKSAGVSVSPMQNIMAINRGDISCGSPRANPLNSTEPVNHSGTRQAMAEKNRAQSGNSAVARAPGVRVAVIN